MSNDTQHYTNLEILHSLVPKLDAISPIDFVALEKDYEAYSPIIDAIATAYRSGYGRGQKGRSFLIGEKKKEIKAEKGAKVCWFSNDHDTYFPNTIGTIGTIDRVDNDGDLWVNWPFESCEANMNGSCTWCCAKKQCLLIDTNVKGNTKKGDKIVYLGTVGGFEVNGVWPSKVTTGVVDFVGDVGVYVDWDDPSVVGDWFNGRTHVWYNDIAKVIPWD